MNGRTIGGAFRRAGLACAVLVAGALLAWGFWIPVKAELAQVLLERAWDRAQAGEVPARPWPWADTTPVAKLEIPAIDASWVVLAGASGRNLAFAPSRMDGSALPGEPGATVIAGHRDTHFELLGDLPQGTEILLEDVAGEFYRFAVSDACPRGSCDGTDRNVLVLVTCFPFNALRAGGPWRYVIQAEPLEPSSAPEVAGEST